MHRNQYTAIDQGKGFYFAIQRKPIASAIRVPKILQCDIIFQDCYLIFSGNLKIPWFFQAIFKYPNFSLHEICSQFSLIFSLKWGTLLLYCGIKMRHLLTPYLLATPCTQKHQTDIMVFSSIKHANLGTVPYINLFVIYFTAFSWHVNRTTYH